MSQPHVHKKCAHGAARYIVLTSLSLMVAFSFRDLFHDLWKWLFPFKGGVFVPPNLFWKRFAWMFIFCVIFFILTILCASKWGYESGSFVLSG